MSTRSVVGYVNGDGFRGRYHHYDGYPTSKGSSLYEILHTTFGGDCEAMLDMLCERYAGWSSTSADWGIAPVRSFDADFNEVLLSPGTLSRGQDDGRFISVPGVGVAYNSEPMDIFGEKGYRQVDPDDWRTQDDTDTDCEWAYAIDPKSLTLSIFAHTCDDYSLDWKDRTYRWVPVAFVKLDGPEPDFDTIEREWNAKVEAQFEAMEVAQ